LGLARVGAQQAEQHADRGGLAGPVGAEEAVHLAAGDVQGEVVEGDGAAKGLGQVADFNGVGHGVASGVDGGGGLGVTGSAGGSGSVTPSAGTWAPKAARSWSSMRES